MHSNLDHRPLGQNPELCVQRVRRVLLDPEDREVNGDVELGVRDMSLLVPQTCWNDVLAMAQILAHKSRTKLGYSYPSV